MASQMQQQHPLLHELVHYCCCCCCCFGHFLIPNLTYVYEIVQESQLRLAEVAAAVEEAAAV